MSYNVLVIPEDFTKDEHVLKPIVERMLEDVGRPNATVLVCRDPNFGGIGEALKEERLRKDVLLRYPMVHLFILLLDRDGNAGRELTVARLEATFAAELNNRGARFLAELARQEVEVFVLAGHELPDTWTWREIRADADVKNTFFRELVRLRGTEKLPHDGRKKLMAEAIQNWTRIKGRCPEDIGSLLAKLRV
jgi:hypothetical protein